MQMQNTSKAPNDTILSRGNDEPRICRKVKEKKNGHVDVVDDVDLCRIDTIIASGLFSEAPKQTHNLT